MDVSVVLPCRNEAATVASCVATALAWIESAGLDGEVVVVDNGSTDTSGALAHAAGARVVDVAEPGYGRALRAGIREACGDVVILADADGTYELADLGPFYAPIAAGRTDVVVGDRFSSTGPRPALTLIRRLGNHGLSGLTRAATKLPVRDVHCGLRSFRSVVLAELPAGADGMDFATHVLCHAHAGGARIINQPTPLAAAAPGRQSSLRPIPDGLRHLRAIARWRGSVARRARDVAPGSTELLRPARASMVRPYGDG